VVRGEGWPRGQVRPQKRIGEFAGPGIEVERQPPAWSDRAEARPDLASLGLVEIEVSDPAPVQDGGIVALRHAAWRELTLDPVGQALSGDRERPSLPVHGPTDQGLGSDGGYNVPTPVGKLLERGEAIQGHRAVLLSVVDPPDRPHPGDVVMSHWQWMR
jgi:hypothetical protein